MYTIYADGDILYSPVLSDDGYGIASPKITKEVNKAGSLSFVMPPGHPLYNSLKKLKTIITVYQDDALIFRGRVLSAETDFYKRRTIYAEGDLAFLNDSVCRPYTFTGTAANLFRKHIQEHNADVGADARFVIGSVTVQGTVDVEITEHSSTWQALEKMIESFGGYIQVRSDGNSRVIDYLQDAPGESGQTIEFGRNLLDLTEHITAEEIFTVLIPLGKLPKSGNDRLTIAEVNSGRDYIQDDAAVALFGRIWKTEAFDDITDATVLKQKGVEQLRKGIVEAVTLTVKAVDLHLVDVDTDRIDSGYSIRVKSEPHGIDEDFVCNEVTLDLENLDQSEYTFGKAKKTASGTMATVKELAKKVGGGGGKQKQIEEEIKDHGSELTKTDEYIRLLVWSKKKDAETTHNNTSTIELTAEEILNEVRTIDTNDLGDIIGQMKTSIEQTSSSIISKVSKNGVISAINQTAESITISASKINLEGYVTASQLSAVSARIDNLMSGYATATTLSATNVAASTVSASSTFMFRSRSASWSYLQDAAGNYHYFLTGGGASA